MSLPEGPGSLEGVGENVSIVSNMGLMRYKVPIEVPTGHAGTTPELALSYSSGAGGSVVGMGWSLDTPYIERMTVRGLPNYDLNDGLAVNGSEQLVRLPGTDPPVYRARYEGSFVRYTWELAGDGREGYLRAEYPDGRVGYFGADSKGILIPEARVGGAAGTFRYHLVEMVDRFGHRARYTYTTYGDVTLIHHIGWGFVGSTPSYEVTFEYEPRTDLLSDCKAGFDELLEVRTSRINVLSQGVRIRRYDLSYEDYATSGAFSRLASVQMFGLDDVVYPVNYTFSYSQSLGGLCTGTSCARPKVVSMGTLLGGVNIGTGDATLIDINGDSLPDVVDTSRPGAPHRFYINTLAADGSHSFAPPQESTLPEGNQGSHDLSSPYVQVLDVDGDGFTDLINSQTGIVLHNLGTGDWSEAYSLWSSGDGGIPDLAGDFDPTDGQLRTVRFLDYDNDKRIDLIRSEFSGVSNITSIYRNLGTGGFLSDGSVQAIGAGFESDSLELNDMNGDGLLDPVQVMLSEVRYRLNLGWGQWSDWVIIDGFSFTSQEAIAAEVEDLNGDGLADLVLVAGNEVHYWLNRNGAAFDPEAVLASADVDGVIPDRTNTTVLFADMNGNGSNDVVWIDLSGNVTYLELFPQRPNLLTRIENGLGKITQITYGTSVEQLARDGGPGAWTYALPHPMTVVDRYEEWDALTPDVVRVTEYSYHDGYYDGQEKIFRGYGQVVQHEPATSASEESSSIETYDVGASDPYYHGLLLSQELLGAGGRSLRLESNTHADCPLAEVPSVGLEFPIRYVCRTEQSVSLREGRPANEWVTTEQTYAYDGYGNVALAANLGVVATGGGSCGACDGDWFGAACGPQCLGDEHYTRTTFAVPTDNGNRWILDRPVVKRVFGKADSNGNPAGSVYSEETSYYDGPDFVGLPLGQLTAGELTRVTERASVADDVVETVRNRLDSHGNVVETIDADGSVLSTDHRRAWTYDASGLRIIRSEVLLTDADGPYQLRRDYQYDPLWDKPVEVTSWMVVRGGVVQDPRNSSFYTYDEFGRTTSVASPGEAAGAATEEYTYELGSPTSRIIMRGRSQPGGEQDVERVQCFDGHGRKFQQRTRVAAGSYTVTGFTVYDAKGNERQVFQPYLSASPLCDPAPPAGTLSVTSEIDALGRPVRRFLPNAHADVPEQAETRLTYLPLATMRYDAEDTHTGGTYADTPTIERYNGLDERVAIERYLVADGPPLVHRFRYDELGRLAGWVDPDGNAQVQTYDLRGRLQQIESADRGTTQREYDAVGNKVRQLDARGVVVHFAYDGANRLSGMWDEADDAGTRITYRYDTPGTCAVARCTNVAGRQVSVSYPLPQGSLGEDRRGYDARGQLIHTDRQLGSRVFSNDHRYDNAGRLVGTTYPNGLRVDVDVDGAGRVVGIPGYVDSVLYEPRGPLAQLTLANGVVTQRTYDGREQLSALTTDDGDGNTLLAYTYERDRVGNITALHDGRPDLATPEGSANYQYDSLYHLTQAELDSTRAPFAEVLSFAYDAIGNLTSKTSSLGTQSAAHVGSLTYGGSAGPHAVTRAGDVDYAYDAAGHLEHRGEDVYAWDFLGRLTHASRAVQELASFTYADSEERVVKQEAGSTTYYLAPNFEVQDGVASTYVEVGGARVARIDDASFGPRVLSDIAPATGEDAALVATRDDAITAADAWIALAVGSGTLSFASPTEVSDVDALLAASAARMLTGEAGRTRYLHTDHLGNTVAITDAAGALAGRNEYNPYGSFRYQEGARERHGYTGKENDTSTGLVYFGVRYLDPWVGRWASPDPTFAALKTIDEHFDADQATGAYQFAQGNPVNRVDPDGRFVPNAVGAIVGAVTGAVMEVINQRAAGNFQKGTRGKAIRKILVSTTIGAGSGAISGGVSGILSLASKGVKSGVEALRNRTARGAGSGNVASPESQAKNSMVGAIAGAGPTGVSIGLSLATGGVLDAAFSAAGAGGSVVFGSLDAIKLKLGGKKNAGGTAAPKASASASSAGAAGNGAPKPAKKEP